MASLDITLRLGSKRIVPKVNKFVRGSYGPKSQINFTIQKEDGTVYDISGLTLNLTLFEKYRRIAVLQKELTNVSESIGTAKYVPLEGDFDLLGYHYIRVELKGLSDKEWSEEQIFQIE